MSSEIPREGAEASSALPRIMLVSRGLIGLDGRMLLVQRPDDDERNPGKWEFPGGLVNDGETPEEAAVRGVQDETGLLARVVSPVVIQYTRPVEGGPHDGALYLGHLHAARMINRGQEVEINPDKVASYAWAEFHEAREDFDLVPESDLALRAVGNRGLLNAFLH